MKSFDFSAYKNKRVFITGHTGFKGTWLTLWLLKQGAQIAGFSKDIPFQPSFFQKLKVSDRIQHQFGDVCDLQTLKAAILDFEPEVVFHLAAQPLVRLSYDQPVETFQANVMGTVHLLESIRHCPSVRSVVLITTDKVYQNQEWHFGYRETDRLGGHDPYSGSKAACELAIESYYKSYFSHRKDFSLTVARAGNVIGGGDYSLDRLIPDAARSWEKKQPVIIRNPSAVRPWQHVLEPLSGYLELGRLGLDSGFQSQLNGEAFNFAPMSESGGTVSEVLSALAKHWDHFQYRIEPAADGKLKKETTLLRLSFEKARQTIQWAPRLKLLDSIEWTAHWYRKFVQNPEQIEKLHQFTLEQIENYEKRSPIFT